MLRFLFGSPFTVPRLLGGMALIYVMLRAGHSVTWPVTFLIAIPVALLAGLVVYRWVENALDHLPSLGRRR